jgi:putative type II/III system pilus formation protein
MRSLQTFGLRLVVSLHFIHQFTVNLNDRGTARSLRRAIARSGLESRMAALMGRCRQRFGIWPLVLLTAAAVAGSAPARADTLSINVDQAQIMHLPEKIATIVIGNPLIADATLQSGGILVVTGKGYGATNLLALDRSGRVVMEKTVQVLGAGTGDLVTVYRGVERESYSCAPNCERRITLGDSPGYFNATLTESGARNGQAATAAPH